MTFEEKCLKEAEMDLRKRGLLKDGETLEDYNKRIEERARRKRMSVENRPVQDTVTLEEAKAYTEQKVSEWLMDPNANVSIDPRFMGDHFDPEERYDG